MKPTFSAVELVDTSMPGTLSAPLKNVMWLGVRVVASGSNLPFYIGRREEKDERLLFLPNVRANPT